MSSGQEKTDGDPSASSGSAATSEHTAGNEPALPVSNTNADSVAELLKLVSERYREEITIRTNVRTKASFLIGAILTVVGVFAKNFVELARQGEAGQWFIGLLLATLSLFLLAILFFLLVYRGTRYQALRTQHDRLYLNWARKDDHLVKDLILQEYISVIEVNKGINLRKETQFNWGLFFFFLAIVTLVTALLSDYFNTAKPASKPQSILTSCQP